MKDKLEDKAPNIHYDTFGIKLINSNYVVTDYFNIGDHKIKKDVVCSSNKDGSETSEIIKLGCADILKKNKKLRFAYGIKINLNCPRFCVEKSKYKVYGNKVYSENSSVCRAAVHAGAIKNSGGNFVLKIQPSKNKYTSSWSNRVKSFLWHIKDENCFTIEKYHPTCPIDIFKNAEDTDNLELKNYAVFLEKSENLKNESRSELESESSFEDPNEVTKLTTDNSFEKEKLINTMTSKPLDIMTDKVIVVNPNLEKMIKDNKAHMTKTNIHLIDNKVAKTNNNNTSNTSKTNGQKTKSSETEKTKEHNETNEIEKAKIDKADKAEKEKLLKIIEIVKKEIEKANEKDKEKENLKEKDKVSITTKPKSNQRVFLTTTKANLKATTKSASTAKSTSKAAGKSTTSSTTTSTAESAASLIKKTLGKCEAHTANALEVIKKANSGDYNEIKSYSKLEKDLKKVTKRFNEEMSFSVYPSVVSNRVLLGIYIY